MQHGTANCFILANNFKKQLQELKKANEFGNQIDEFEQEESGYTFDSITKLTEKILRYHDKRASSFCKLPKPFCNSKSIVNIQNDVNYSF